MRRTIAMVVLITANFMDLLDTTIVNVALPELSADTSAGQAQIQWVVAAYALGFAGTLVLGGRLGDRLGRRSIFVVGVIGFTCASLACAMAPTADFVIVARAGQGAFAGLMVPQVLAAVQDLYEPERRGPIFGLVGFVSGCASVAGPLLGGWLLDADPFGVGWRGIFIVNVPVGVVLAVVALFVVPHRATGERGRVDFAGLVLAMMATVGVMVALIEGRQAGWPAWCWVALAVGLVAVGALCLREATVDRRAQHGSRIVPFLPLRLFRDRGFTGGTLANMLYQAGLVSFFLYLTMYLQKGRGLTPLGAGLTWLGFSLGTLVGSVFASLSPESRRRIVMCSGALITGAGFAWVALIAGSPIGHTLHDGWEFAPGLTVAGLGFGALIVPLFGATLEDVPRPDAGGASGALSMLQQFGGALGIAAVGLVFFGTDDMATAFSAAGLTSAALFVAAGIATLTLGRQSINVRQSASSISVPECG